MKFGCNKVQQLSLVFAYNNRGDSGFEPQESFPTWKRQYIDKLFPEITVLSQHLVQNTSNKNKKPLKQSLGKRSHQSQRDRAQARTCILNSLNSPHTCVCPSIEDVFKHCFMVQVETICYVTEPVRSTGNNVKANNSYMAQAKRCSDWHKLFVTEHGRLL